MTMMAPPRPAELRACRVHLTTGPARNPRLPRGRLAPSPYTCTHASGHAGQASR